MEAARAWSAAFTRNVGRRAPTPPAAPSERRARGSALSGRNRKALSTVAVPAGGPARSSGEALVTGVDAKGPAHHWFVSHEQPGQFPGGDA
jgi:hypothetical protein